MRYTLIFHTLSKEKKMRKKYLGILLFILAVGNIFLGCSEAGYFSGGDGSLTNPYLVSSPEELNFLARRVNSGDNEFNSKSYKLVNDIDLLDFDWVTIGTGKISNKTSKGVPLLAVGIQPFLGSFNGNGYKVMNLKIISGDVVGVFGIVSGGVKLESGVRGIA